MNSAAVQVPPQRLQPATGGGDGERDRAASRLSGLLSWKTLVIGACVVFTIYIAVVPLGFLLWQSFFTPQTATKAAVFTFGNYITAHTSSDTARLVWNSVRFAVGTAERSHSSSAPRWRGSTSAPTRPSSRCSSRSR